MSSPSGNRVEWKKERWIERKINWQLLRGFGQSIPATITMLTPFIGYLILYHSEIKQYMGGLGGLLTFDTGEQTCGPILEFSFRLHLLYLGLLSLGLGTILFRATAPIELKKYKDIRDFVSSSVDKVTARNLRSMYATIQSRRPQAIGSLIERAPWLDRSKNLKTASDALLKDKEDQIKIDVLSSYYSALDRNTYRAWIYLVLLLFSAGFVLLAIPSVAFTSRVLCAIWI